MGEPRQKLNPYIAYPVKTETLFYWRSDLDSYPLQEIERIISTVFPKARFTVISDRQVQDKTELDMVYIFKEGELTTSIFSFCGSWDQPVVPKPPPLPFPQSDTNPAIGSYMQGSMARLLWPKLLYCDCDEVMEAIISVYPRITFHCQKEGSHSSRSAKLNQVFLQKNDVNAVVTIPQAMHVDDEAVLISIKK